MITRLRNSFSQMMSNFLTYILPDHTKRLMLFASLAACADKSRFDNETIRKLNQIMELSCKDKALIFPIHLSRVIWSGPRGQRVIYSLEQGIGAKSLDDRVNDIIAQVPPWLKYSSTNTLREDLVKLLTSKNELVPV